MVKSSYNSIYVFKFLAAIMVVAIHTNPFFDYPVFNFIITSLCRIAVPFFFVFSSFIFFKTKNEKGKNIIDFLKRIVILYCFWFVVELPIIIDRFFIQSDYSFLIKICLLMRGVFINNTFCASWYLTALCEGMLVVDYVSRRYGNKAIIFISIAFSIFALSGTLINPIVSSLFNLKGYNMILAILIPWNSFFVAVPFCYIGKWLAEKILSIEQKKYVYKPLFLCSIILFVCEIGFGLYVRKYSDVVNTDTMISLFLLAPLVVILLIEHNISIKASIASYCRKTSILIYLTHGIWKYVLLKFMLIERGMLGFCMVLILSILTSLLIIKFSSKCKMLKYSY